MQLRRLELVGFKTFVDRTDLEFHPGITAIVGPNGSGKSNIFDSIRWALGEANARLLRGARMEDVIFSGSATRRPHGLATVSLTLDNSAGLLPVEFSEVTVSRTVTRGGEGEYAINGVDCRLRDVQMLFLGTGLGGRSYALIGQGEVDAVLRATPVERRRWLEEAAGLARNKRQRVEAERRLEHAGAHTDRLSDLAEELEHQRQSLAGQAEAAAQHRAWSQELRDLEVALFADEARRLLGAVRRLSEQLRQECEEATAAGRRASEAAADVALVEAQLSSVTAEWERGQRALLDGAEALSVRAGEVQAIDAQAEGLRGQLQRLREEVARLAADRAARAADLEVMQREAEGADGRHRAAAAELQAAEECLRAAAEAAQRADSDLAMERTEAVEVARALAQSRSDLAALRARAEVLAQSASSAARRAAALAEAAVRLAADREAARAASSDARRAVDAAADAVSAAAAALEDRRRDAAAAYGQVRAAELEEQHLRTRLAAVEEAAAQLVGFEEGARRVLLAARDNPGQFPGLRGALADLVDVPEAFRPAVAAALGRCLHAIVVSDRGALDSVVRFVRGERGASATVIALDTLRAPWRADAAGGPGSPATTRAIDVIEADGALRPLLDALIGDLVVASDLDAAWRLFDSGYPGRIATMDGALVSPEGAVSIGDHAGGQGGPLGRGQVISSLRQALADAEARRSRAEAGQADARGGLAAAEDRLREASAAREAAGISLAEHMQRLARYDADLARLAEEEAARNDEARSGEEALRDLRQEIARAEADVRSLEQEAERVEARVLHAQEQARRSAAVCDEAASAAAARRLALVQLEGDLQAVRVRLEDRAAAVAALEDRHAALVGTARRVSEDLAALEARREEAAAAHERRQAEHAAARAEVEILASERVRLRDLLGQGQEARAGAVEAAHAAEAAAHRTEVRAAQAEAELAAAASRLQEQYGISLEEAASRRLEGSREEARRRMEELGAALRDLGPVNMRAVDEHAAVVARLDALRAHIADLRDASDALRQAITHINAQLRVRFRQTFDQVNAEFARLFQRLFEGGQGYLELVEDELETEPGLEVIAQLPGKARRALVALSGGERVLVALALIFAMLRVHPSPFCIFDEVEAALDDANTRRFTALLRDLAQQTQVLIITHNKGTMSAADILYGVTMQEPGLSSIVSVRLVPPPNGEQPGAPQASRPRQEAVERRVVALPAE